MGCCISKCKPKENPDYNPDVQDKLVVSQSPTQKRKIVDTLPPLVTSDSLTCSTQSSTCGSSSLSSASSCSSVAFSKVDRSFSNDFLQSCAMENLQIIGLEPVKKVREVKQLSQGNLQKRARATSPNLTRQKSFRVEKERLPYGRSSMRTPSPSRRFNTGATSNYQRQGMLSTNAYNQTDRRANTNTRPASPNRNIIRKERPNYLNNNKDSFGYKDCSNVEEVKVEPVLSKVSSYSGSFAVEDLENPHIALDCFIFL